MGAAGTPDVGAPARASLHATRLFPVDEAFVEVDDDSPEGAGRSATFGLDVVPTSERAWGRWGVARRRPGSMSSNRSAPRPRGATLADFFRNAAADRADLGDCRSALTLDASEV